MASEPHVGIVGGDGEYRFPVVGESHYQANIERVAGPKTESGANHKCFAALFPEPSNPHDVNAVRVDILDRPVGYLSRDTAPQFLSALKVSGLSAAVADAIVVGGWDRGDGDIGSFGVKLNVKMPFQFVGTNGQKNLKTKETTEQTPPVGLVSQNVLGKKKRTKWPWVILILLIFVGFFIFNSSSEKAERLAQVIQSQFSGLCVAKIEGSDTLRLDWTGATKKINLITILAAISESKNTLYSSGIRYLKFPNSSGGYNIVDWKTGKKSSVTGRAPYYFPD